MAMDILPVRVTKEQKRTLKRAANKVGMPVSTFIRVCAVEYANAEIKPFVINKQETKS